MDKYCFSCLLILWKTQWSPAVKDQTIDFIQLLSFKNKRQGKKETRCKSQLKEHFCFTIFFTFIIIFRHFVFSSGFYAKISGPAELVLPKLVGIQEVSMMLYQGREVNMLVLLWCFWSPCFDINCLDQSRLRKLKSRIVCNKKCV